MIFFARSAAGTRASSSKRKRKTVKPVKERISRSAAAGLQRFGGFPTFLFASGDEAGALKERLSFKKNENECAFISHVM